MRLVKLSHQEEHFLSIFSSQVLDDDKLIGGLKKQSNALPKSFCFMKIILKLQILDFHEINNQLGQVIIMGTTPGRSL